MKQTQKQYAILKLALQVASELKSDQIPAELFEDIVQMIMRSPVPARRKIQAMVDEGWISPVGKGYRVHAERLAPSKTGLAGVDAMQIHENAAFNLVSHWNAGSRRLGVYHILAPHGAPHPLDGSESG
ncbi:hypothetical protein A2348_03580 [Candidatus Uhrbacteria bacterium RIFOXYB12_FULL_58_10]|uniref:Uncharacterized protein n=1 Tax=Candidatus Uhrbacteria bacterium RIFOXYB2_FULL_57_15 TaxID=1802422 RepID=A0A1F7W6K4_9BACT|nr:MAG: hypothetical protein A2348_03580 [Candidatus Uhrbacteria bacterium RIFOXYB12_FULL_58_10]OGL98256.1 MAG: hypothetical protein A2304_00190 [Candidatus Uhrbacteria bacterium RIFOXYB2_FULL_57_15]